MQSKAATVEQYLQGLPPDRRTAIQAVRQTILKNLDKQYEEGMQYGMIGYYVPHSIFPAGYHCDPRQPLTFAGLASQKNHMAVYLMCVYGSEDERRRFEEAWKRSGKKLDMGKSCIRFKKVEDLALDVLGEAIRRVPAAKYIERYESLLQTMGKRKPASKPAAKGKKSSKPAVKKSAQPAPAKARTKKVARSAK
jgi:uncharacterized protein DUF1801